MIAAPPCEADPDRWFIERDGRKYDDEVLVSEDELRATLTLEVQKDPKFTITVDAETIDEIMDDMVAAKVKARLVERRHARDDCFGKCPVRTLCLQQALDNREQYGIWGGYYPEQRRALEREIDARRARRRDDS